MASQKTVGALLFEGFELPAIGGGAQLDAETACDACLRPLSSSVTRHRHCEIGPRALFARLKTPAGVDQ